MKSIEWAKAVAENPEGHPRGDVEAAASMLLEALNALERETAEIVAGTVSPLHVEVRGRRVTVWTS